MPRMHAYTCIYKALPEAEKYKKVTSITLADVCMFYFEIEVSHTQGESKSHSQHIHYLPEIYPITMLSLIHFARSRRNY